MKNHGELYRTEFVIFSDTSYHTVLRQWVSALRVILGPNLISKKAEIEITLGLIEAINNAIFHAHDSRQEKRISVSLSVDQKDVMIDVIDGGDGIGSPELPRPDEMVDHGRGLFLIRSVMKSTQSQKIKGMHRLRMVYEL